MDYLKDLVGLAENNRKGYDKSKCEDCLNFKEKLDSHKEEIIEDFEETTSCSRVSQVAEFYRDKSVFITGATGFLGKVLVEKLLRCTDVKTLYLLLRTKKGKDPNQRLEQLLTSKVFRRLKTEKPKSLKKLVAIPGDITLPNLDICTSDLEMLKKHVSIVFHSAATVKFNEPLKFALEMNTFATRKIVKLCKGLPLIDALVYVSTAYCNCHLEKVDEMVYPTNANVDEIARIASLVDGKVLKEIGPHFLEGRPNTYTYSKALAENVVVNEKGSLPVAIVRPSIVIASVKEPMPGWVDGAIGPTGMMAVTSKGVLKTGYMDVDTIVDAIPVDIVINALVAAGWSTGVNKPNQATVYNVTSGCLNPLSWQMVQDYGMENIYKYPCKELYRYPEGKFTKSRFVNSTKMIFDHYIPGYFADLIAPAIGYKPGLMKLYKRIVSELDVLEYFYLHEWKFHCKNILVLDNKMNPEDKELFELDVTTIEWRSFFKSFTLGVREFILKEDSTTIPAGKVTLKRMYILKKTMDFLGIAFFANLCFYYSYVFTDSISGLVDYFV